MIMYAAGGEDIFQIGNRLATESRTLLLAVVGVVAIVFVIWKAVESRMAVAAIAVALLAAGLLSWGVYNVLFLRDRTGDTVQQDTVLQDSAPAPSVSLTPAVAAGPGSPTAERA